MLLIAWQLFLFLFLLVISFDYKKEQKQRRKTRKRLNHFADCQMKRSFRVSIGDAINP